jgi:hypothetical protein
LLRASPPSACAARQQARDCSARRMRKLQSGTMDSFFNAVIRPEENGNKDHFLAAAAKFG